MLRPAGLLDIPKSSIVDVSQSALSSGCLGWFTVFDGSWESVTGAPCVSFSQRLRSACRCDDLVFGGEFTTFAYVSSANVLFRNLLQLPIELRVCLRSCVCPALPLLFEPHRLVDLSQMHLSQQDLGLIQYIRHIGGKTIKV